MKKNAFFFFFLCLTEENRNKQQKSHKQLILSPDMFRSPKILEKNRTNVCFENVCGCLRVDRPRGRGHRSACSCTRWEHSETSDSAWRMWADWSGSYQTRPVPAAYGGRSSLYLRNTSGAEMTPFNHYKTVRIFVIVNYFTSFAKMNGSFYLYWCDKHQRWLFCWVFWHFT